MVSTRQETGKGTASEHCLLFNLLTGCEQVEGGLVGSSVSIAFVFIFWNTFKVDILKLYLSVLAVAPGASCSLDESCALVGHRLCCNAKCFVPAKVPSTTMTL